MFSVAISIFGWEAQASSRNLPQGIQQQQQAMNFNPAHAKPNSQGTVKQEGQHQMQKTFGISNPNQMNNNMMGQQNNNVQENNNMQNNMQQNSMQQNNMQPNNMQPNNLQQNGNNMAQNNNVDPNQIRMKLQEVLEPTKEGQGMDRATAAQMVS
jgi:hypothetical protein